jgi:hypothetical protein
MEIQKSKWTEGCYLIARPARGPDSSKWGSAHPFYWEYYNRGRWSSLGEEFPDFVSAVGKYKALGFANSDVVVKYTRPRTRYEIAIECKET